MSEARIRRRSLARGAAGVLGVFGAGAALGLPEMVGAAGLTRANPVVNLTFMPWWVHWDPAGTQLLNEACAHFGQEAGHKGLRLTALQGPQGGSATTGGVIASMLGGVGPDVVGDCCGAWVQYLGVNLAENLSPYVQRDNLPVSTLWSAGRIAGLTTDTGLMGLPIYDGPVVFAYNQGLLDDLGLPYPDPEWTWEDAAKLWRQAAGFLPNSRTRRYGAGFWWGSGWYASNFLFTGFGGAEMDATRTKCLIDQPGAVAAAEWILPLFYENIVYTDYGNEGTNLTGGTTVFEPRGGWDVHYDAVALGNKLKWDYVPAPKYPQGRATFANNDFWIMNANSAHKEGAWEVMKWLAAEDFWQSFVMQATLLEPSKLSLWDKWEYYWQQAAPIFRTKQISWYKDAALGGYAYPEEFFKYQSPQADSYLATAMGNAYNRKSSVAVAFKQAADQVNALEAQGPAIAAAQAAALARTKSYVAKAEASSTAITYPAPPRVAQGAGAAPTAAGKVVAVANTQVTLSPAGGALQGSSDQCAFAGSAATSSRGVFTCRLVSVSLPKGGALSNFPSGKIGLMARGSLGDESAAVAVFFSNNRGVHAFGRPLDGLSLGDERPSATPGLLAQSAVQVAATPKAGGNWLLKPVWFKLQLENNTWTPYTSLDGSTWQVAGAPELVEFVGAWVGVFASSGKTGQVVQAVFDHLTGFSPSDQVILGSL